MASPDAFDTDAKSDMTAMVDVVFLLIIFFLCIDFKTLEARLPAHLPQEAGSRHMVEPPVEILSVKIVCEEWGSEQPRYPGRPDSAVRLVGHRVHWMINAKRYSDKTRFLRELERIVADPARRVPDPQSPGRTRLMSVVVEPGVGAVFGDVAQAVDLVRAAGFDRVDFGGGRGKR